MRYAVDVNQGELSQKFILRKPTREELISIGFDVPVGFFDLRVFNSDVTLPRINVVKDTPFESSGKVEKTTGVTDFIILGVGGRVTFNQVEPALEFVCKVDSNK